MIYCDTDGDLLDDDREMIEISVVEDYDYEAESELDGIEFDDGFYAALESENPKLFDCLDRAETEEEAEECHDRFPDED